MTILILHGVGGFAGVFWQQWLHDELLKKGHTVLMPTLPFADHPKRSKWLDAVSRLLQGVDPGECVIVGHSLGVAAALDFIEQASTPVQALISVAGFGENYGSPYNDFFMKERDIDFSLIRAHLKNSIVIYSDHDPFVPQKSLVFVAEHLGVKPVIIPGGGHFNATSSYKKTFPFLLDLIEEIF